MISVACHQVSQTSCQTQANSPTQIVNICIMSVFRLAIRIESLVGPKRTVWGPSILNRIHELNFQFDLSSKFKQNVICWPFSHLSRLSTAFSLLALFTACRSRTSGSKVWLQSSKARAELDFSGVSLSQTFSVFGNSYPQSATSWQWASINFALTLKREGHYGWEMHVWKLFKV